MASSNSPSRFSRRTLLKTTVATSAALLLEACGGTAAPPAAEAPAELETEALPPPEQVTSVADAPASGQTEVRFATDWTEGIRGKTLEAAIPMFEEANPTLKIKLEPIGGDYFDKLQIQFAGGTVADIILFEGVLAPDYIAEGLIADIEPTLQDLGIDQARWRPGVPSAFLTEGKVYAIPFQFTPYVWYYNKTLFEKNGVDVPDGTWDWTKTREVAKQLTKPGESYGQWVLNDMFSQWASLALANGEEHWTTPDAKKTLVGEPSWVDAIRYTIEAVQVDKVAPAPDEQQGLLTGGITNLFATGKIGMVSLNAGSIGGFKEIIGDRFEWDVMPAPKAPRTGKAGGMWNDQPHVVTNGAQERDVVKQATQFVVFLSGDEVQGLIARDRGSTPTVAALQESEAYLSPPPAGMQIVVDELKTQEGPLFFPRFLEWYNTVNKEYERGFLGERSVEDTIAAMVAEGDKILAENE